MLKYMLNYIFRAGDCDMIYWIVGFNLTVDVHKKPYAFTLLNQYTVIMALASCADVVSGRGPHLTSAHIHYVFISTNHNHLHDN